MLRLLPVWLILFTLNVFVPPVWSQTELLDALEDGELPPPKPLVIFTVANIENSLSEVGKMFEVSGRPDVMEVVEGFIGGRLNELQGVDRTLPIGVMMFLTNDLPPQPSPMAYIPVSDLDALLKTLELGPMKPKKVEGSDNRFELAGRRRSMHGIVQDGYAYITRDETLLDAELPDPRTVSAGFAAAYDVSVSVQIQNVAPGIRELFINLLKSNIEAELQQRDDEPYAAYKMRSANGKNIVGLGEQILRDGKQLTLGLDASHDGHSAAIELLIDAEPESKFAQFLKNIGGKPSHFAPLVNAYAPLCISLSWGTDERERDMLTGNIEALVAALKENLPETSGVAIDQMAKSLNATVEQEHVDAIFQFVPQENRTFVLMGGLKLMGAANFSTALTQVLDAAGELEGIDSVELNVDEHQSVILHRLRGKNASSEDKRIYGGHPDVYLGAGNGVFWFGLGSDAAISELNRATDILLEAPATQTVTSNELGAGMAPFQITFRVLPWMDLPERENANPLERELTGDAMANGADGVRLEVRPTENGGRIRAQFDEGFVKLLGLMLATQYDRTQL